MVAGRLELMAQEPQMTLPHARDSHPEKSENSGSFLGGAVRSLLVTAGVAAVANVGRKMAVQAPTAMASDWCDGLVKEHRATLEAIDKLAEVPPERPQRRGMVLMNIKHMIAKHALQEEQVIYPMLRRGEDIETLRELNGDHGEIKALLFELGEMDKADPAFLDTLAQLREQLEEHMREEEEDLFPALRERLSEAENRKLTRNMNMAGLTLA
jgi:hemerythrin superfamily protein